MTRWQGWAAGAAMVAAAWALVTFVPGQDVAEAPFVVTTEVGERAEARNLALTVLDARSADAVTAGIWHAEGSWVVVDLEAEALTSDRGTLLALAQLTTADGRVYRASERPESFFRAGLDTGLPRRGSIAFELPADARTGMAVLRLGLNDDPRLDSVVEVTLDLDALPHRGEATLTETGWSTP